MARAILGAVKLLQRGEGSAAPSPLFTSVRHIYGGRRRKRFLDPFLVPTLYLGNELLPEQSPKIKPKAPPDPPERRNLNKKWRMWKREQFKIQNLRKMIAWEKARKARHRYELEQKWRANSARVKEWKADAIAVYATKKTTANRRLPECLLSKEALYERLKERHNHPSSKNR